MEVKVGVITIYFPNASLSDFFINEDLAELFGLETSHEAAKYIKKTLKDKMESSFKKLKIDYETNGIFITSIKGDVIVEVANIINELIGFEINKSELAKVNELAKNFKRPKKQKWVVGGIFFIPLSNSSYSFGQIIKKNELGLPIGCLFELVSNEIEEIDNIINKTVVSILPISSESLDNHTWKIIGNKNAIVQFEEVIKGQPKNYVRRITRKTYSDSSLKELAEALNGIRPWNENVDGNYFDKMLVPSYQKPDNLLFLTREEKINHFKKLGYDLNQLEASYTKIPDWF
ncbi:Imm26 family immunity protein [Peribacillus sp. FSL R5-0717]|uniref:Imm26 family immunity protein n=1 Tax=Peribacillus sp. FSL R5-0717 TaxID=2975308 RepID=UPI0030F8E365